MPLLIILAMTLSISNSSVMLKKLTSLARTTHDNCLHFLPKSSQNPQAHAALLCGENVTVEEIKSSLIRSSLIHLFVVSGSHLLLLEEIFIFLNLYLLGHILNHNTLYKMYWTEALRSLFVALVLYLWTHNLFWSVVSLFLFYQLNLFFYKSSFAVSLSQTKALPKSD